MHQRAADDLMWSQIVTLHARIEHELTRALHQQAGLGLSDYRALSRLAVANGGELRMQNLAEAIGLDQSSVSRLVARLERAGLTQRDICPEDRRGIYSVITEEGRERQAAAEPIYVATLTAALARHASDPDLADAVRALRVTVD